MTKPSGAPSSSPATARRRRRPGDPGFVACGQDRGGPFDGPAYVPCTRQAELWCKLEDELYCRNHGSWHVSREGHEKTQHRWLRAGSASPA